MEKVPQIVSERLKATAVTAEHPDADVLTAFSERSLAQAERADVLEHLARCGECREIVALALPASEPTQEVAAFPKAAWLTWPRLRWGVIAAGIVAIASFGFVQYQRQRPSAATMAYKASPEALSKEAKNLPPSVPTDKSSRDQVKVQKSLTVAERADQPTLNAGPSGTSNLVALPVTPQPRLRVGASTGNLQHGPRVQWQQQNANNFQYQTPASPMAGPSAKQSLSVQVAANAPAADQTVAVDSSSVSSNTVAGNLDSSAAQLRQRSEPGYSDLRVERTKPVQTEAMSAPVPAPPPAAAAAGGPAKGRDSSQLVAVSPGSLIAWNISPSGSLQRSLDQGSTWQNVDVTVPVASASELEVASRTSRAKEAISDRLKKKDASTPVFRAVASNGTEVWAGAANGLLYHSADAGNHWTRVVPTAAGATLAGDIVSLEFIDPQHGRIVTSNPEIWTTSDAGQSWQKQ